MFKLTIKNADASVYWTQKFKDMTILDLWLNEEKTRPYWKQDFTTEVLEIVPPPPPVDSPDEVTRKSAIAALKLRLNALDAQPDLTAAELKEMARKFFKLFKLKGLID